MGVISNIFNKAHQDGRKFLFEHEAKKICSEYNIPTPLFRVTADSNEAVTIADQLGYPVVLKIISPQVIHKSDVGGVALNLRRPSEVKDAYLSIINNVRTHHPQAKIIGVLVEKMASPSFEMIVGALNDPHFGQTLMLGIGGVYVEVYKDVTFRIAPIDRSEAEVMIDELKGSIILEGYRGRSALDKESVIDVLLNVSKLVMEYPYINQLDLNPLIVYEEGITVVDARIILDE